MHLCAYYQCLCKCLYVCDQECVFLKFDDSAGYEATVMSVNSAACLAVAQGCCSHGRHIVCEQHIWDWDRQGLACSCNYNMPSSTTHTSFHHLTVVMELKMYLQQYIWTWLVRGIDNTLNCSSLCSITIMCN